MSSTGAKEAMIEEADKSDSNKVEEPDKPELERDLDFDDELEKTAEVIPKKKSVSTLRALLWKNFILKRKRRRSTCCEVLVPAFFIVLIIVLKGLTQIEVIPEGWTEDFVSRCPYNNRNATSQLVQVPCPIHYDLFDEFDDNYFSFFSQALGRDRRTPFGKLCLSHSGNRREESAIQEFVDFVAEEGITETGPFPDIRSGVVFFNNEQELFDYLKSPTYGLPFSDAAPQCTGALIFNSIDFGTAQFKYTIRGNATFDAVAFTVPETDGDPVDFERDIDRDEIDDYTDDGWYNLQALVDSYLISRSFERYTEFPMKVAQNSRKAQAERVFFERGKIRNVAMPINEFTRDIFFTLVQEILPLIFIVVYLMPVSQIIAVIVLEKEVRAREMMRLMGVSDFKIISSWFVTYTVFFLFIALLFGIGGNLMFPATTEAAGGFSLTIFFIFFSFGLSVLAYSFVISTFFKKAFNAVVFGLMTYVILFFLFYFFNEEFVVPTGPLLIPQIAFGFTIQTLAIFEETGIGVSGSLVSTDILGFNLARGIAMMLFDAFYLTVLGFYLNTIIPGEFGTAWPFYFPFLPKYWKKAFSSSKPDNEFAQIPDASELVAIEGDKVEEVNESLKSQISAGVGVQIRGMTKVFNTPDGDKVAVDNLNLDVFEGQILVLLGHNGAGKTTTLQMLTGSLFMTHGEAYIYGNRVRTDLGAIRKSLGFCPQHDVLYKELTVYDHLKFYGKIKSISGEELEKDIDDSLLQVGLTEKKYVKSKNLSGGMKRKLSLAISLIGKSKVIFVDEPTSGVDTFSRRSMWEILQNAREGRVIILTTHFMDEADLLGDRIAIMAEGQLQCVGSSFFLKQTYGAGYRLVFTKKEGCLSSTIEALVKKHVSGAAKASDVGTELSFHLPVSESHCFAQLFAEVDELLENDALLISSYGVSVTTMEEVFLKAGQSDDLVEGAKDFGIAEKSLNGKELADEAIDAGVFESNGISVFLRQFLAMFLKRISYARRDRYAFVCNTLVPVTIFCIGLLVLTYSGAFDDLPPFEMNTLTLNPDFPPDERAFMPIVEFTQLNEELDFNSGRFAQQSNFPQFKLERPVETFTELPSGVREVFNRTYFNGRSAACLNPFCGSTSAPPPIGDAILDIGEALISPDSQFIEQIQERNGASVFASAILIPEEENRDRAGCFFAEFGIDLNTGFTIGQNQVQCSEEGSPCVMLEVTLNDFFGNDFFTCIPAGCLSDLNEDVLNTLFAFVDQGIDVVEDDFVDTLLQESAVFICEGRLCNLAPATLDEFSICRGGDAFIGNELCVDDDLIALETEFILNDEEDAVEDVTIDIDRNASYCEGKDVSGISIDDFIRSDNSRFLQDGSAATCLDSTINEELETLIQLQADLDNANAEATFDSRLEECVDEQFACFASVLPLSNETSLCVVDSCMDEAQRVELAEDLIGVGIGTQIFLSVLDGLDDVPCSEIINHCQQTLDYQSSLQILDSIIENDSLNTLVTSDLFDLLVEFGQNIFNSSVQVPQTTFETLRILQTTGDTCVGSTAEDCNILRINGICAELTCEKQLELLGFPPGTSVQELVALASLFPDIDVVLAPCDDQQLIDELNCTNDIIFSLESLGLEIILDALGNGEINTVQDLIQVLDSLEAAQLEVLTDVLNGFLNTTLDGAQIDEALAFLNSNFELLETFIVQPEFFQDLLAAALNSGDTRTVACASSTDTCVLVELDLNFGLVCLPAGCSSDFFNLNSTREIASEADASFNGVSTLFICNNDNCNTGCQQPSNCESDLLQPVLENTDTFELIPESRICRVFRAGITLLLNTTAKHIAPIAFSELHTVILRRSLVEYFDFTDAAFDGLNAVFHNNTGKFDLFEAGQIGDPNVEFSFPDESRAPKITVISHPMPFTQSTQEIFEAIIAFTTAIFCLLAYAFIPGPMISYVVMEKEEDVQIKHLQFVSGAGVFAYWASNYVFDIIAFLIPFFISLLLIMFFDVSSFLENGAFEVVAVVLFGYGLAIIPFSYLFGHLFKKHTTALIWIIIINCLTGLTLMIASFAMDQVPETVETNKKMKWLYRFSPGFCMGDSLLNIAITGLTIGLLGEENSPGFYDRDVAGANIKYLYLEALLFFFIVVFIEFAKSNPVLSKYLNLKNCKAKIFGKKEKDIIIDEDIDEDVQAEADRVIERVNHADRTGMSGVEGGIKPDVLEMINLRKVYSNGKVAVRGVTLGVPEGECFGYLGINGAGKTTTLKCLTGDIFPTSGNGYISGHSIVSEQWAVRRNIGYCSQFSSILGLLTVREHLELFCRIKQVIDVEDNVQKLLRRLSLSPFENKLAKSLSGGNKRKLSVAIAMIGSPDLMLLDEPSTGMDVASRRYMWNVIENMVAGKYDGKKTSVILTTHSMEECEALCSRVGIMVGGRLRCLGSIQHLKSRFGTGYTVEAKINYVTKDEVLAKIKILDHNEDDIVGMEEFDSLLAKFEENAVIARVKDNPNGVAWHVLSKLENGGIHLKALVEWVLQQKRIVAFEEFLRQTFKGIDLVEAHDYKVTYRIEKTVETRLSNLFEALEANKDSLQIAEYSVAQTTLEQIFNGFAAQQDEEQRTPRGVVTL